MLHLLAAAHKLGSTTEAIAEATFNHTHDTALLSLHVATSSVYIAHSQKKHAMTSGVLFHAIILHSLFDAVKCCPAFQANPPVGEIADMRLGC
jgi:hypothetical protein